jgi:hypothetical protein
MENSRRHCAEAELKKYPEPPTPMIHARADMGTTIQMPVMKNSRRHCTEAEFKKHPELSTIIMVPFPGDRLQCSKTQIAGNWTP